MSNSDPSRDYRKQLRRAIDRVCNEFETAWRNTPTYTVERILPRLGELVRPFEIDPEEPEVVEQIVSELIRVEMDMRHAARTKLERSDYHRRFPDYSSVIDESWDRIRGLEKGESAADAGLAPTVTGKPNSGAGGSGERVDDGGIMELPQELGPFVEISEIGNGSFGVVCRAVDSRDATRVALKFPKGHVLRDSGMILAFCKEAERVMKLDHPGIVKTYSVEQLDGHLVIVLQLITGTDLKQSLSQSRTQGEIAELVAAIAEALAYANRMGVVHRDLKPANILLDEAGRPFIADFGMALDDASQVGAAPVRCGSIPYMSPQLVAGLTRHLDGRTDIWSLGVILYLMLTGRRPFRGKTDPEIFDQIESRDPKPLRQIDGAIAIELERICLKCLEKRACDRYATGDDLADDLRHWMEQPAESPSQVKAAPDFIPKGLRSYTAEDSEFFLDLLPGPKDRDGMPASIRFWKNRICEPVAEENRVPVGVIYGPSGSGKSSFVKAGLVPQLSPLVEAVYVEATQLDTEVRTIKALRRRFPGIPEDVSIPELFAGLSAGRWQGAPKKILIVMDQFEQHLSKADDYQHSQLAKALRHCDGEHLQCLLLIRDDFWLALTRFVDALEMDLLEGQNSQAIDLFGQTHARKVLIKLGQAYGCLPTEGSELSDDQARFLETAIDQLAIGNYVICVRLTLFAEMFKSRDWTTAELKSVGGVQGVGEKFLEETFGAGNTSRRFQLQRESVQAVLEALLPESGSDIRGSMKSEQELLAASGLAGRPDKFKLLIQTLDTELRLITRTDPDLSGEVQPEGDGSRSATAYFQLTHDYLVPSIREWLSTELKKTRSGRARLRLRELATQVVPGEQPKYLPTNLEWASWQLMNLGGGLAENESSVMRFGRRRFLSSLAIAAVPVSAMAVGIYFDRNRRFVKSLVANLMGQEFDQTLGIINDLKNYKKFGIQLLHRRLNEETGPKLQRARLGVYALDPSSRSRLRPEIVDRLLLPDSSPQELLTSVTILEVDEKSRNHAIKVFETVLADDSVVSAIRLRAGVGLAYLQGRPEGLNYRINWGKYAGLLIGSLVREPNGYSNQWIEALVVVASDLRPIVEVQFVATDRRLDANVLAMALFRFLSVEHISGNIEAQGKHAARKLSALLLSSNDAQFDGIISVFEERGCTEFLVDAVEIRTPLDKHEKARSAVALLRLKYPKDVREILKRNGDEELRYLAILFANSRCVEFRILMGLYSPVDDSLLRQGVLMMLAEYAPELRDSEQTEWLFQLAKGICLNENDAGCFAVAELIARRLPRIPKPDSMKWRRIRRRKSDNLGRNGSVVINCLHQAFSVIEPSEKNRLNRPIAVAIAELSENEWREVLLEATHDDVNFHRTHVTIKNFFTVYRYCNQLSLLDGFVPAYDLGVQHSPEHNEIQHPDVSETGYRLPTVAEWLAYGNSDSDGGFCLDQFSLSHYFAWTVGNREEALQEPGLLLPNSNGIFDSYGNAFEACTQDGSSSVHLAGWSAADPHKSLSPLPTLNIPAQTVATLDYLIGIRLVRSLGS